MIRFAPKQFKTVYHPVGDGDTLILEHGSSYYHQCCDCGLVHRIDTKVDGNRVELTYIVEARRTSMVRYWRRLKGKGIIT